MSTSATLERRFMPMYYRIKQSIISEISCGKFAPNEKLPSKNDLMRKYNTSCSPVDQAIAELVKEGIVYTIQGKGIFVADRQAEETCSPRRKTVRGSTLGKRIALIFTDNLNEFYSGILNGILSVTQPNGGVLEVSNSRDDYALQNKILRQYNAGNIDAVMFIPTFYYNKYNHLYNLQRSGVPVVLIDRDLRSYNFDCVMSDNFNGTREAIRYLLDRGHRQIVCMGLGRGTTIGSSIEDRYRGFRAAFTERGLPVDESLMINPIGSPTTAQREGYKQTKKLLASRKYFSAMFFSGESLLLGAYRALKEAGKRVPHDISLIGFDDCQTAEHFEVPLTMVRQDTYAMGRFAAERLFALLSGADRPGKKTLIPTKLIVRESVRDMTRS